jgi:hypothetical protein
MEADAEKHEYPMVDERRRVAPLLRREEPFGRSLHPASLVADDDPGRGAWDSLPTDDGVAVNLRRRGPPLPLGADATTREDGELTADQVCNPQVALTLEVSVSLSRGRRGAGR